VTLANDIGEALVRRFEDLSLKPMPDTGTRWQIGFGMNFLLDGTPVGPHTPPISEATAVWWLACRLATLEAKVDGFAPNALTDNQKGALYSFGWNEGEGALSHSTLLEDLVLGQPDLASAEFPKWVYANGHVERGLVLRRKVERAVFDGTVGLEAIPTWMPPA
jgi:lysozyme